MNILDAITHIEAFICGGDELGDVSKEDATEALRTIEDKLNELLSKPQTLHEKIFDCPNCGKKIYVCDSCGYLEQEEFAWQFENNHIYCTGCYEAASEDDEE